MSSTPIFDAVLADAPQNIWQASYVFPQPTVESHRALCDPEWTHTITGWVDPTNLSFLQSFMRNDA